MFQTIFCMRTFNIQRREPSPTAPRDSYSIKTLLISISQKRQYAILNNRSLQIFFLVSPARLENLCKTLTAPIDARTFAVYIVYTAREMACNFIRRRAIRLIQLPYTI